MFGKKIKELRKEKGISQRKLAKDLNVIQAAVAKWETDRSDPSPQNIKALAIYFEVTTDYLFGLEDYAGRKTYIKNSYNTINGNNNRIGD